MTSRTAMLCRALAAWLVVTVALPFTAAAEYDIPAGSPALMTAGQPTLVRITPGWDAAVAYEIADGVPVTVWDAAQAGPDGSLWYPIDGGFVPAESVTSLATLDPASQEAQEVTTEAWVEPIAEVTEIAPAPVVADEEAVDPATAESVDLTASAGYVDPTTGAWVEPATLVQETAPEASTESDHQVGNVDPNTGAWVEPALVAQEAAPQAWIDPAAQAGYVDPTTGAWIEPTGLAPEVVTEAWIEPVPDAAPVETPAESAPVEAWVEPAAVEDWAAPAPVETVAVEDAVWEPDGSYVELEQRGKNRNNNKDKDKKDKDKRGGDGRNDGASTSAGQQIADFALQYQGYPYVYAGEGPNAFDCSGFTMFVIRKTLGVEITHDMFTQYDMGQEVGQGELQPGDLVFFKNTFRRGMSHNGIYIGGGQFVHAENESTGVVVSDLNSDYYGSRWYGAVRFG